MATVRDTARLLYIQSRTYIAFDRALLRTLLLAAFCVWLVVAHRHLLLSPLHRAMALAVMSTIISFIAFYELTVRDAPSGAVLAVILSVLGGAALLWLGLVLFYTPLPNDHAPLRPDRDHVSGLCVPAQSGMRVLVGWDQLLAKGDGQFTPFRVADCPAPSLRRTAQGLMVSGFGYDGDGSVIWQLSDNRFTRLEDDSLHLHRFDRGSLGIYDRWEREIFFVRFLAPDAVRMRGRFLCGAAPPVNISERVIEIGAQELSRPRCLKAGAAVNYAPRRSDP
jgi:hypothetical protein